MFDRVRSGVLRFARLPHDPSPPAGGAGSLRVFRASRKLYRWRLFKWGVGQAGALLGIMFSLQFLDRLERAYEETREQHPPVSPAGAAGSPEQRDAPDTTLPVAVSVAPSPDRIEMEASGGSEERARKRKNSRERAQARMILLAQETPPWIFPLLTLLEFAGILVYLVQIPITFALVRLDYELRWYMVTDRSLRIRSGIATVQESTMSFANVQHVVVSRTPIQRLLGIADVRVQSAGGGGSEEGAADSLHTGIFHGVDNADQIRDLILERLRLFRETGLGDPDEPRTFVAAQTELQVSAHGPADALAASHELLEEARALRRAVSNPDLS